MAVSIFEDKAIMPDDGMVAKALESLYPLWSDLQSHIEKEYPNVSGEWKHYGKSAGWSFKLISKKRNLIFVIPNKEYFRARIVLGDKAIACLETADLSEDIKEAYRRATPYVEGRSVDMDINSPEQVETVKTLLKIKFEN